VTPVEPHEVVVFAPFSGITTHAVVERFVARELAAAGARVLLVTCSGALDSRCVVIESKGLDPGLTCATRAAVCRECIASRPLHHFDDTSAYETIDIDRLIGEEESVLVERIRADFLARPTPDFTWDDVPLGSFWCFETVLKYKSESLTEEFMAHFRETAHSGALAFVAGLSIADSQTPPRALLCHTAQYALNRSFAAPFIERGIDSFSFANSGQLSRWQDGMEVDQVGPNVVPDRQSSRDRREQTLTVPLAATELSEVLTWVRTHTDQKSSVIYSTPRGRMTATEVRTALGLRGVSTVVAFSSSPDERLAANMAKLLPPEQQAYDEDEHYRFAQLVADTAESCPDIDVVYRLHPRLAPNNRDPKLSPHLGRLIDSMRADLPNLILNVPDQGLSLYSVAMVADAGLNWSSTAGLEFLLLGIPVIGLREAPSGRLPTQPGFRDGRVGF
jgi:hypothetical protein